ncbi:MAG: hypothetical protein LBB86_01925 [Oscillospiraceae bacterium]|jgi:DNA polymerase-3 subunit epsilon|nr:hypothetical protein [Oscillospiraceae bacterium]
MFAVFDVEKANSRDKGSICSIGFVFVEGNQIVGSFYSLVKPLTEFSAREVSIHGITEADVLEAPTFAELWPEIWERIANMTLIAFDAYGDICAIQTAAHAARFELPSIRYGCAFKISKKLLTLDSYRLVSIAEHFSIAYKCHDALCDAFAAASVLIELMKQCNVDSLGALMRKADLTYDCTKTNGYDPAQTRKRRMPRRKRTPAANQAAPSMF